MSEENKTICLFDVDGTLTKPRQKIETVMAEYLEKLRKSVCLGVVGGSDLNKIVEQIGDSKLESVLNRFDYVFAENGLIAYRKSELIGKETIAKYIGEEKLQKFLNYCLEYMSKIELPFKRGTFVEFRNGMINISPVGRSVNQEERDMFFEYDMENMESISAEQDMDGPTLLLEQLNTDGPKHDTIVDENEWVDVASGSSEQDTESAEPSEPTHQAETATDPELNTELKSGEKLEYGQMDCPEPSKRKRKPRETVGYIEYKPKVKKGYILPQTNARYVFRARKDRNAIEPKPVMKIPMKAVKTKTGTKARAFRHHRQVQKLLQNVSVRRMALGFFQKNATQRKGQRV